MTKVYLKFQYWYRKYIPATISNTLTKLINKNLKIQMILFRLKTKIINYRKTGFEHLELLTIEEIVSKLDLKNKSCRYWCRKRFFFIGNICFCKKFKMERAFN